MPMSPRLLRPRAATSATFDPRAISGLVAWYDASDASTRFQNSNGTTAATADNDPVGYLADKGPNGYHMTQSDNSSRPLLRTSVQGGRAALLFDGANDHLINNTAFLNGYSISVAFVAQRQSDTTQQVHVASVASSGRLGAAAPESAWGAALRSTYNAQPNNLALGTSIQRRNGSGALATGAAPTAFMIAAGSGTPVINATGLGANVLVGAGRSSGGGVDGRFILHGHIGELVFYSRPLSVAELQALESYFSAKWGVTLYSPPSYADADVNTYITTVEAADGGVALETGVRDAINTFITGCKADGIWSAIKAACILMGARTLSGALTPLVGSAPTNNGPFVSGDYNRKNGLAGNGSTKFLDSNRNNNADPQDSKHIAVYVTALGAGAAGPSYIGTLGTAAGGITNISNTSNNHGLRLNSSSTAGSNVPREVGFCGTNRSSASEIAFRNNATTATIANTSATPANGSLSVFGRFGFSPIDATISFYSIGESINLSLLRTRLDTLYTAIGAAIP